MTYHMQLPKYDTFASPAPDAEIKAVSEGSLAGGGEQLCLSEKQNVKTSI